MAGGITAAVVGGAAVLGGAYMSSQASKSAANTQADAARYAADQQSAAAAQQLETAKPWVSAGTTAINQLSAMTQPGGEATKEFAYQPFDYTADPGYAFRFKEGMKALNANAAARGGLISGNALRAATGYGQELGSQEYMSAFDRYLKNYSNAQNTFQMNRNNLLEPLKFISGQGQAGAANQAATIGANAAANSALITGAANANAAGQIGSANAYTNAIGQGVNAYQMNQLINRSSYTPASTNYYSGGSMTIDPNTGATNQPVDYSDIRMKENIEVVGQLPSGLNIYSFEYKPEFKDLAGYGKFIGVMAQEAEKIIPDSVVVMENGYKAVKYNLIH